MARTPVTPGNGGNGSDNSDQLLKRIETLNRLAKEAAAKVEEANSQLVEIQSKNLLEVYDKLEKAQKKLAKIVDKESKSYKDLAKEVSDLTDAKDDLIVREKKLRKVVREGRDEYEKLNKEQKAIQKRLEKGKFSTKINKSFKQATKSITIFGKNLEQLEKDITKTFSAIQGGVSGIIGSVKNMASQFMQAYKSSGKGLTGISKGTQAVTTQIQAQKSAAMGFLKAVSTRAAWMFIGSQLIKTFQEVTGQVSQTAVELKISSRNAAELVAHARKLTALKSVEYATTKNILSQQQALVETYGAVQEMSPEVTDSLAKSAFLYGYSNQEAGKLQGTIRAITGDTDAMAAKQQEALGYITSISGMASGIIAEDVVNNAGVLAKFFSSAHESVIGAVYEARRLGLNLSDFEKLAGAASGNLEEVYRKEAQLSVAFGKQFSLENVRRLLATPGASMAEIAQEMARSLEGILNVEGFSGTELEKAKKMQENWLKETSAYQRQLIANALNMTEQEIAQMLERKTTMAEISQAMTEKFKTDHKQLSDELLAGGPALDNLIKLQKEHGWTMENDADKIFAHLEQQKKFGQAMTGLKNSFQEFLIEAMPVATWFLEKLTDIVKALSPAGKEIAAVSVGGLALVTVFGKLGKMLSFLKSGIMSLIGLGPKVGAGAAGTATATAAGTAAGAGKSMLSKAKGGVVGAIGGVALEYGADKLKESGHETAGSIASIGSNALTGAGFGAMVGGPVGAAVGGALGGLYGIWDEYSEDIKNLFKGDTTENTFRNSLSSVEGTFKSGMDGLNDTLKEIKDKDVMSQNNNFLLSSVEGATTTTSTTTTNKSSSKAFTDVVKDSEEFRKAFPLPKSRTLPGQTANNLQLRENEALYKAGIGDDATVERVHSTNSKHYKDQAIDIPVIDAKIDPSQGDRVSAFWKSRGYKVIWHDGGAHDNHVHVSWDASQPPPNAPTAVPTVDDGVFPASRGTYSVFSSTGKPIANTSPGDHLVATPNLESNVGGADMSETNRLLKDLISHTRGLQMVFERYAEQSSVVLLDADTTRRLTRTISTMK